MIGPCHSSTLTMLRDHGTWSISELWHSKLLTGSSFKSRRKERWALKSERLILINSSFGWLNHMQRFTVNLSSKRSSCKAANGEGISCIPFSKSGQQSQKKAKPRLGSQTGSSMLKAVRCQPADAKTFKLDQKCYSSLPDLTINAGWTHMIY